MLPLHRANPGRFSALWPAYLAVVTLATLVVSLQHSDDALCALLNIGLFTTPLLLALTFLGRPRAALAIACTVALFVWGAGELKFHYFGERFGLMDFYFMSEGSNWGIVKRYPRVQWALFFWSTLTLLLAVAGVRLERQRKSLGARGRLASAALLLGWGGVAFSARHHHVWEVFRDDADCGADKVCGVMSRLIYSYSAFEKLSPLPAASPGRFLLAAAALPSAPEVPAKPDPKELPDVVVWLHESTFDPTQYRLEGADLPRFSMFAKTRETRASGKLRVHTFGGRTWLSEFSLLTGLVPNDFGARADMVFNSVAPEVQSTLVQRFAAAGYECVALMPTPRTFYGAARTYASVGFQRVLTLRDFPEYDDVPGDEWDIADSDRLAEAVATLLREHHERMPERPIFLYLLSIKEHSPYAEETPPAYGLALTGDAAPLAGKLTDYVGRLATLDRATRDLEHTLLASPRKALWLYFGDHQANFEIPSPPYRYDLPVPGEVTQYQLRASYALPISDDPALLDIALLGSLVVDAAGLPRDPYYTAQSAMRKLCQGRLDDCPDRALVESYKGHVFGKQLGLFQPRVPLVAVQMP